ncbi:1134_t:CDS:2, partial [Gigaspora margarita]
KMPRRRMPKEMPRDSISLYSRLKLLRKVKSTTYKEIEDCFESDSSYGLVIIVAKYLHHLTCISFFVGLEFGLLITKVLTCSGFGEFGILDFSDTLGDKYISG